MRRSFLPDAGDELPGFYGPAHGARRSRIRWGGHAAVVTDGSALNSGPPPNPPIVLEVANPAAELGDTSPLIGVTLNFMDATFPAMVAGNEFRVYAEISFQTDAGKGRVEVDIPHGLSAGSFPPKYCGGTCVAVPAGSGLIIRAWGEGAAGFQGIVSAIASPLGGAYPSRAIRSRQIHLPMPIWMPIPGMARAVRCFGVTPAAFGTVDLQLTGVGAALAPILFRGPASQEYPIPAGAANFRLIDLAPVPAVQTCQIVFEVGL